MKVKFKIKVNKLLLFCILLNPIYVNAQNAEIEILRNFNINRNKSFDPTFNFISKSAVHVGFATPILIYGIGFIKKDSSLKKQGIYIGESFLVASFITTALKKTIQRDRPYVTYPDIDNVTHTNSYSFPSGHTSSAFATATSLSMAFPKWYVITPSFIWAGSVGYSRMHLGVHYPSDVLAGALIGSGSAYLTFKANQWLNKKRLRNGTK